MSKAGFTSCGTFILFCFAYFLLFSLSLMLSLAPSFPIFSRCSHSMHGAFVDDCMVFISLKWVLIYIMNTRCLHAYWNIQRLIQDNIDTKYSIFVLCVCARRNYEYYHILDIMNTNIPCGVFKYTGRNQWRVQKKQQTKLYKCI